jgi:DNA-binding XRE family transcriptional regulator
MAKCQMRFAFTRINLSVISVTVNNNMNVRFTLLAATDSAVLQAVMITPAQIRAARALLGWKQTDLAVASGVSEMSIKNIERGVTDARISTIGALQAAFLAAGVIFLEPGDMRPGGAGVRLA